MNSHPLRQRKAWLRVPQNKPISYTSKDSTLNGFGLLPKITLTRLGLRNASICPNRRLFFLRLIEQ